MTYADIARWKMNIPSKTCAVIVGCLVRWLAFWRAVVVYVDALKQRVWHLWSPPWYWSHLKFHGITFALSFWNHLNILYPGCTALLSRCFAGWEFVDSQSLSWFAHHGTPAKSKTYHWNSLLCTTKHSLFYPQKWGGSLEVKYFCSPWTQSTYQSTCSIWRGQFVLTNPNSHPWSRNTRKVQLTWLYWKIPSTVRFRNKHLHFNCAVFPIAVFDYQQYSSRFSNQPCPMSTDRRYSNHLPTKVHFTLPTEMDLLWAERKKLLFGKALGCEKTILRAQIHMEATKSCTLKFLLFLHR